MAVIAQQPMFAGARRSILGRFIQYLFERLNAFISTIRGSHSAQLVVILAIVAIVAVIIARIVLGERVEAKAARAGARRGRSAAVNAWANVEALAAAGDYTGACHAMYVAVVDALARDGALTRHASKTSGDYSRELRIRAATAARDFRAFAADFDRVIYGAGVANQEDYQRLRHAAETAMRSSSGMRAAA